MKYRGPLLVALAISTHRTASKRKCNATTALLAFTLCLAAAAPSAFGQATCPQPPPVPASDPLHTLIPVHFDPVTGNITVGSKTYCGSTPNPGFHLLALSRQPDPEHLDAPDKLYDLTLPSAGLVNHFLNDISSRPGGPIVMVNAVGDYGIPLSSVYQGLKPFGAYPGLQSNNASPPFIFIGNAGRAAQTALQRGGSTLPLDGYLVQDSNGNYTFTQIDFVHYDITTDGTIKIGGTTYDVASSYKPGCSGDASNSFHLVVVERESLQLWNFNNTYCTAQSNSEIIRLVNDMSAHKLGSNPTVLVFLASNGNPIPADWNFGTDGDARFQPLAQQVAQLGGYWETMAYLTPNDTYSLVGAAPFFNLPRPRAQESSSVYPADVNGNSPTGELHGVLARGAGNWYSPLNADPTGTANLQLYDIVAQPPVAFPHPNGAAEVAAFQFINENLCGSSTCNVRNQYGNLDIDIGTTYEIPLESMTVGPNGKDCMDPQNAGVAYCVVRAQLLQEFISVSNIRDFYDNVTGLWDGSGSFSLAEQLGDYQKVLATIPAPPAAPAPSLVNPLVNLFLGLGSKIPNPIVGPIFGLADLFFNFGTALTTEPKGTPTINLTSTIGNLEEQAANQFIAQAYTTGTLFEFIYEDWGKMSALGNALASGDSSWSWSSIETAQMLQAMGPAIQQAAYQNIMPAAYAIGRYVPQSNDNCGSVPTDGVQAQNAPTWGNTPLYEQIWSYGVLDAGYPCAGGAGVTPVVQPFNWLVGYIPYTYPTDTTNPYANNAATGTILADGSWLGISALGTPPNGGTNGAYEPPDSKLLKKLFTPVSQTLDDGTPGLGVYRPAFFESWPFTQETCAPAYGVYTNGGSNVGGCPWPGPTSSATRIKHASIRHASDY